MARRIDINEDRLITENRDFIRPAAGDSVVVRPGVTVSLSSDGDIVGSPIRAFGSPKSARSTALNGRLTLAAADSIL